MERMEEMMTRPRRGRKQQRKRAILLFVTATGRVKSEAVYVAENRMVMVLY
jgi:hypothetical protein